MRRGLLSPCLLFAGGRICDPPVLSEVPLAPPLDCVCMAESLTNFRCERPRNLTSGWGLLLPLRLIKQWSGLVVEVPPPGVVCVWVCGLLAAAPGGTTDGHGYHPAQEVSHSRTQWMTTAKVVRTTHQADSERHRERSRTRHTLRAHGYTHTPPHAYQCGLCRLRSVDMP